MSQALIDPSMPVSLHKRALATTEPHVCPVGSISYSQGPEAQRRAAMVAESFAAFQVDPHYLLHMAERAIWAKEHPIRPENQDIESH